MSHGHRRVGGVALAVVLVSALIPGAPAVAGAPAVGAAGATPLTATETPTPLAAAGTPVPLAAAETPAAGGVDGTQHAVDGDAGALFDASQLGWGPGWYGPGLDTGDSNYGSGGVRALTVWDDGAGPALYAGGWTITAGSHVVNRVARWDGQEWAPLTGPDGTGVWMEGSGNPSVKAIAVYQGDLIVAGFFDRAGGVPVDNIARWDGQRWSALPGGGLAGSTGVETLTVHDGRLVAGGRFRTAGGEPADRVAAWDGEQWSAYGDGIGDGGVYALASFDGTLYAGGTFTEADGASAGYLAAWDGQAWAEVGDGLDDQVRSLSTYGGRLVVGGRFTAAGDGEHNRVAAWDGDRWSAFGEGIGGSPYSYVGALTTFDGDLVAAGNFPVLGDGRTTNYIARWDGDDWSTLSGPAGTGTDNGISVVLEHDGRLFAGSQSMRVAGGVVANYLAAWDGDEWSAVSTGNGPATTTAAIADVRAMTVWDGDLVAAGNFRHAGSQEVAAIARWDGVAWSPLPGTYGLGLTAEVNALTVWDGDLIVGGRFRGAGELLSNYVARYDGEEWSPLVGPNGVGVGGPVNALAVYRGDLFAAGAFTEAGGVSARAVARWDGTGWSDVGGGADNAVYTLAVHDDELVAGGLFTTAGGVDAARVARWDGQRWAPLATGFDNRVFALGSHDGVLYAGGGFRHAGDTVVNRVARWDGSGWAPLTDAAGTGVDGNVYAVSGYGGDVYIGGSFTDAGGVTANGVARWDGSEWSALNGDAPGVGGVRLPDVDALHPFDADGAGPLPERLLVGGTFQAAGGSASWGIASYGPTAPLAHLSASPEVLRLGPVEVGETGGPAQLTLAATGNQPVTVEALPEPEAPFVFVGGDCPEAPFTLAPTDSCTVGVALTPESGGEHRRELTVPTSGAPATLTLVGKVLPVPAGAEVGPEELTVEATAGGTAEATVDIRNPGEEDLHWRLVDEGLEAAGPVAPATVDESPATPAGPNTGDYGIARAPDTGAAAIRDSGALSTVEDGQVLTHSESMEVLPGHSVSCTNGATGHTRAAQFLRTFELADFGVEDDFLVTGVTVGVQSTRADVPVTVRLYELDGALRYDNLRLLGEQETTVTRDRSGRLVTVPVQGVAPAGGTLVVELSTPDLAETGWFYAGANDHGESAPSYFASVGCDLPEPTPMAAVGSGYPDVHLAMAVTGRAPVDCARPGWLAATPESGAVPAAGEGQVTVAFDTAGLEPGEYDATLCLVSDAPEASVTTVPVSLSVTEPEPVVCDETVTGVHVGALTVSEGVTCLAAGAQVLGEVNVAGGAGLVASAAVVQGPVSAVGASVVDLAFTQVTGPVLVSGGSGRVSLFAGQVTGSVSIVGNSLDAAPVVAGNTVIGSLSCFGNEPPPTDQGLPNTATAGALGQCADL